MAVGRAGSSAFVASLWDRNLVSIGVSGVLLLLLVSVMPTASANAETPATRQNSPLAALIAELANPKAPKDDYFGNSVAVSGKNAVVGAFDTHGAAGAAYIYVKGASGWPTSPTVTLKNPGATAGQFGSSVAISGNTIIVGAPVINGDSGAAYIYVEGVSGWPKTPTVSLADPGATAQDLFGSSVAISGTTAVVGAPKDTSPYTGAAYIYVMGTSGWPTTPTATLADPAGPQDDSFGYSVAVSETTAVVGAIESPSGSGAAYIYTTGGGSVWQTTPTATLADPDATARDQFGFSVALSGTTAIVSAPGTKSNRGAAYIYVMGASVWPTTPTASLASPGSVFGYSVVVSGKTVLVGATGNGDTYVYVEGASGWPVTPTTTLTAGGGAGDFGCSVAMSGTTAFIGAFLSHSFSGEAYIYDEV